MASLTFKFNLKLSLLFLFLWPILVSLGFWQLERADEKRNLLAAFERVKEKPASSWRAEGLEAQQLVKSQGHFDDRRYWLLDNSVRQGKVGYEVIMPFYVGEEIIYVNRGWVRGDVSRRSLPSVDTPGEVVSITGRVYIPTKNPLLTEQRETAWPKVIVSPNLQLMAQQLGSEAAVKYMLRLQQDSAAALTTGWPEVNVLPQKHQAYAVQWFAMAVALFLLFFYYSSNIQEIFTKANHKP